MTHYTFDDVQHAYLVGIEHGQMCRLEVDATERAHELIHEQAVAMLGLARREATQRHGAAWAALVCDEEVA